MTVLSDTRVHPDDTVCPLPRGYAGLLFSLINKPLSRGGRRAPRWPCVSKIIPFWYARGAGSPLSSWPWGVALWAWTQRACPVPAHWVGPGALSELRPQGVTGRPVCKKACGLWGEKGENGPPAVPGQPAPRGGHRLGMLLKCESGADFEHGPEVWPRQHEEKAHEQTRAPLHLGPGSWRGLAASHLRTHTCAGGGRRLQSSRCAQRPVSFLGRREARLESASIPVWGLSAARVGPVGGEKGFRWRLQSQAGGGEVEKAPAP